MSIPERLWRVAKGHWSLAQEKIQQVDARASAYQEMEDAQNRVREVNARASAYEELAEALRQPQPVQQTHDASGAPVLPAAPVRGAGEHDPLEAAYALLRVQPGADLAALEQAYQARKDEIHPEYYAEGSPERTAAKARGEAVDAAYQKLRDVLNPVENRFEKLEF